MRKPCFQVRPPVGTNLLNHRRKDFTLVNIGYTSGNGSSYRIPGIIAFPVLRVLGRITFHHNGTLDATADGGDASAGSPLELRLLNPVAEAMVEGEPLSFTLDTGATVTTLSVRFFHRFQSEEPRWQNGLNESVIGRSLAFRLHLRTRRFGSVAGSRTLSTIAVTAHTVAYKLAWMDRLIAQIKLWLGDGVPTAVGGEFNVIPEEIDCHKRPHGSMTLCSSRSRGRGIAPCSVAAIWMHSGRCTQAKRVSSLFGTTSAGHSSTTAGFALTTSCSRRRQERCSEHVTLIKDHEPRKSPPITRQS